MTYKVELMPQSADMPAYQIILLNDLKQSIGYALGELRQYTGWYDGKAYFFLTTLVVDNPEYRQQGLGSQLLKAVEAFARRQGASWVRGQLNGKPADYAPTPPDERALSTFWVANGYGLKREIYDESIRFWKPLHHPKVGAR